MPIRHNENPEGVSGVNKFLAKSGDGLRGKILAINIDKREAIVLSMNSSMKGDVKWGKLYLIRETDQNEWPRVVKPVDAIPDNKQWVITAAIPPKRWTK